MFARLIALATLALSRASALTLVAPTGATTGGSVTITWQATTTDPPVFSLEMVNTVFHNSFAIANNVQTSTGSLTLQLPRVPVGDGYTIEAVDPSNIITVYAISGDFVVSAQSTSPPMISSYDSTTSTTPAPLLDNTTSMMSHTTTSASFVTMSYTITSAPSQTSSQSSPSKSSSNTSTVGTIAGAVVGGVVLLVILVVLGIYYKRKVSHSSDLMSSRRLQRNDDGCEVIDGQAQASSPINPFPYQTAPVHFVPRIQPKTLSHHLSASSFTVSNGASPLNSTQASRMSSDIDGFARHPGAGSSSMSSSGGRIAAAAGATGINPPQIIMHVDSEDVPVAPDVIELPPQYVERQPLVAEPTSLPNQKPL